MQDHSALPDGPQPPYYAAYQAFANYLCVTGGLHGKQRIFVTYNQQELNK